MIEAVVFGLGHAIVDFPLNEEALLAAYREACALAADRLLTETPLAYVQVAQARHRAEQRIEEGRLRQDVHEFDFL